MHDPTEDRLGGRGRRAGAGAPPTPDAGRYGTPKREASDRKGADAFAHALRDLRSAGALSAILTATDEFLRHSLGVDAYAVVEAATNGARVVLTRGLERAELAALSGESSRTVEILVTGLQLGTPEAALGWLTICRLAPGKTHLDASDFEMLAALRTELAVAIKHANEESEVPTVRPPSLSRMRTE